MGKYLIFDAGPIISLSMNGLLYMLERLKKECDCEFLITPQVKKEVIEKPLKLKKFELEAIKVKSLMEKGILVPSSRIIPDYKLMQETKKILDSANSCVSSSNQKITIIQEGEASCLALAKLCNCENMLVIDERTTRLLVESPENLKKMMERKLYSQIKISSSCLSSLKKLRIIRSSELLYVAYKKNLLDLGKEKIVLDSLLYASKFKGTAISSEEIEEIKKMA